MKYSNRSGFTLTELMFAMTFLASILLFATLVFVQGLAIYNKGLTIKQINETGRSITTDLSRSSNSATNIVISGRETPQFICIGATAYMWNVAETAPGRQVISYDNGTEIGMVRTKAHVDARVSYCSDSGASTRTIAAADFTDLIGAQARVLKVQLAPASITPQDEQSEETRMNIPLVRLTLTIGTSSEDGALDPIRHEEPADPANPGGEKIEYWNCPDTAVGNFCAVGTYSTTIYLANGA